MSNSSIETIWFIALPSMTIEFSAIVSRPPSVAVPPVLGTTLMVCSLQKARVFDTSSVLVTRTTAAGIGRL